VERVAGRKAGDTSAAKRPTAATTTSGTWKTLVTRSVAAPAAVAQDANGGRRREVQNRYDRPGRVNDLGRQAPTPQQGRRTDGRVRGAGGVLVRRERRKGHDPALRGPRPEQRRQWEGRQPLGAPARAVLGPTATSPSVGHGATATSPCL